MAGRKAFPFCTGSLSSSSVTDATIHTLSLSWVTGGVDETRWGDLEFLWTRPSKLRPGSRHTSSLERWWSVGPCNRPLTEYTRLLSVTSLSSIWEAVPPISTFDVINILFLRATPPPTPTSTRKDVSLIRTVVLEWGECPVLSTLYVVRIHTCRSLDRHDYIHSVELTSTIYPPQMDIVLRVLY